MEKGEEKLSIMVSCVAVIGDSKDYDGWLVKFRSGVEQGCRFLQNLELLQPRINFEAGKGYILTISERVD